MVFFTFIDRICDRIFAVFGALLFSQAPEFFQQYLQCLHGHAAELKRYLDHIQKVASTTDHSLNQYIRKFIENGDPDISNQGLLLQHMVDRLASLNLSYQSLAEAKILNKPLMFFLHIQPDIAQETFSNYQLGLPVSFEGVCYAIVGTAIGYVFYTLVKSLVVIFPKIARYVNFFSRKKSREKSMDEKILGN